MNFKVDSCEYDAFPPPSVLFLLKSSTFAIYYCKTDHDFCPFIVAFNIHETSCTIVRAAVQEKLPRSILIGQSEPCP